MNRALFQTVSALLLMLFVTFGCTPAEKPQMKLNELTFTTQLLVDSQEVVVDSFAFRCSVKASIDLPIEVGEGVDKQQLTHLLSSLFIDAQGDPLKVYAESLFVNFQKEMKLTTVSLTNSAQEEREYLDAVNNEHHERSLSVLFNSNQLLSIGCFQYDYTGGIHGYYFAEYYNYQLPSLAPIVLDDLIEVEMYDQVASLLIKQLCKQYEVASVVGLDGIGFFNATEIALTDNISLSSDSLAFHYQPYEIAAYAFGAVEVKLAYNDLKPYLKSDNPLNSLYQVGR